MLLITYLDRERRYELSIGAERFERLKRFTHLVDPITWDKFIEGLHCEYIFKFTNLCL